MKQIQSVLDPHCLIEVHINPESRVRVLRGSAPAELVEQGWRAFLVKVHNDPGLTGKLEYSSRHALPIMHEKANVISKADISDRWMDLTAYDGQPMKPNLSGLKLEYRILQIYSRDAGRREGEIACNAGQGTQDIGFRNSISLMFNARAATDVTLHVYDTDGKPTTAGFIFRDEEERVYPYAAKRLEPDFFFHDQVYRANGEKLKLPAGKYKVTCSRGPEYLESTEDVTIPEAKTHELRFDLKRWIDPNERGWYSGDHHVHAAGCMHYKSPTQGVDPPAMMRHVVGEALNVGCVLTWGPAWYHQKEFFTGKTSPISTAKNIIRYDVEVSGFPSDHCGHLVLLHLKEDDYPGTEEKEQWPTWDLPILQWAKSQGAVVGVAHSGWGLDVAPVTAVPNYVIPPMNGIGAQEYLVDVALGACDFISTVDTPYVYELNMLYHTLNCGFQTKISGETDFPCIYGDRVGLGRSYVKLDTSKTGNAVDFDAWVDGIKAGRCYVSDGHSHLMDFTVNGVPLAANKEDRVDLDAPAKIKIHADVAAWLDPLPPDHILRQYNTLEMAEVRGRKLKRSIKDIPYFDNREIPYWHIERARIAGTRRVPVEVVVNGVPVASQEIMADGTITPVDFEVSIEQSSWVALRILPSSHTNPINVIVGGKPVRASRKSAQWCLDSIDQVWKKKSPNIREGEERDAALEAFNKAREIYRQILAQCDHD
ncbi:CehA/McbA family metallohydrolase [Candidatus Sumerlaeota bacterium]|nr:CehA/McbA family metallohydrolase [Candidatus Sumerlaeota bacterium]